MNCTRLWLNLRFCGLRCCVRRRSVLGALRPLLRFQLGQTTKQKDDLHEVSRFFF